MQKHAYSAYFFALFFENKILEMFIIEIIKYKSMHFKHL